MRSATESRGTMEPGGTPLTTAMPAHRALRVVSLLAGPLRLGVRRIGNEMAEGRGGGIKETIIQGGPGKSHFCGLFARFSAGFLSGILPLLGASGDDFLATLFRQYCDWAYHLHPVMFSFLLRATLMFGLSVLFCYLAFRSGRRSVLLQVFILINSVILALAIPVERIEIPHRLAKAWIVALAVFLTATLPAVLPLFVARELGNQQRWRRYSYGILLLLLLGTLLRALPS